MAAVSIAGTRLAGPLAGGLAATAQLMWLVHHSARDLTLWNPTLVPAIASGVFLACALMIERGATRHVVWAGVWLGVAIDIHPTCLGLLPGYLLIAGITRHGSPLHLAAALLVPLATRAVISPHVLAWNVGYIAKVVGHVEVTALLVPVVVVAAMRRPWRRLPQRAVLTAGPLVWAGAFVAATAPVWASGRHVDPRYFECLVPLLAIALGVATVRLGRACGERFGAARACRWGCASVVAAALVFGLWPSQGRRCDQPPDEIRWELADMEAIGRHLSASGLSYRDVFPALRARDRVDLMQGLAPFMDRHPSGAPARSVDPMLVALVPASAVVSPTPESWSVVPLDGCAAAIVRNLPSTLDESRSEACYRFSDEPDPVSCFDQRPAEWFEDPGERFRYYDRVYPQPPRLAAPGSSATGDWDVRYRIPYATPDVAPAPRLVHIGSPRARNTTSACADACEWRVDSLGPPLEVSARCDEAPRSRRHHCASMPPVVETAPDESALRRSLGLDDDDARVIGSGEPSAEPR